MGSSYQLPCLYLSPKYVQELHVFVQSLLLFISRSRLATCFEALARADSLIAVFRDSQRLLRAVGDVSLGLDETEASLDSALWALRTASPGLFFLTDGELLDLMSVSYHDIGATEHYLGKIFPWFSKLVLVEGTENLVTERVSIYI